MNAPTPRVAVVTGAGGGIGEATSARLAADGYRLALLDYSPEAVDKAVATVRNQYPDIDVLGVVCNVADETSVSAAVTAVRGWADEVHTAALVAGVLQHGAPVEDLTLDEFNRVFDVNVRGVFLLTKALVPLMPAHDGASLTAVASWSGQLGSPFFTAYCASKAAVIVFMQSVATELAGRGIRANTVSPGNIATSMHIDALQLEADQRGITFEEMKSIEWAKIPLGYAGDPATVADAIGFLASPQASYITGTSLDVNGGVHFK